MGLLCSRSRSQWRFKMSVNVCLYDIFWITVHFVTKFGMVMRHYEPECHAEKLVHPVQWQSHSKGLYNQNMTISVVSSKLLVGFQPNLGLLHLRSRSQWRFEMLINVFPHDIFWTTGHFVSKSGMVMQHHKPECHAEKLVHCVQYQGHSEGLYNQNMTISVVSFKLLVGLQLNFVW